MNNTTPSRYPSRGTTDKKTLYQIIDEGLFCTIAFVRDGIPHQIPSGFCRVEDDIYIHASVKSGFLDTIIGKEVSFSVTHLDAIVLAPTAFDHSFNYRSVIGFAKAAEIIDRDEKRKFFNLFTDRYIPGRIADVGEPTDEQIGVTKIIRLSLENAGAKIRNEGMNVKLENDNIWCGIIPVNVNYGPHQTDHQLSPDHPLPEYIHALAYGSREPQNN